MTRLFEVAGRGNCAILDAIEGAESFEPSEVTCHYSMTSSSLRSVSGLRLVAYFHQLCATYGSRFGLWQNPPVMIAGDLFTREFLLDGIRETEAGQAIDDASVAAKRAVVSRFQRIVRKQTLRRSPQGRLC